MLVKLCARKKGITLGQFAIKRQNQTAFLTLFGACALLVVWGGDEKKRTNTPTY
jgi:hypothetical protein